MFSVDDVKCNEHLFICVFDVKGIKNWFISKIVNEFCTTINNIATIIVYLCDIKKKNQQKCDLLVCDLFIVYRF